jgi:hypothetical protein
LLRITIENDALPEHFPVPLRATLTAAAGTVDFAALEVKVQETADWVFGYYNQLIEEPADALRGSETTPG